MHAKKPLAALLALAAGVSMSASALAAPAAPLPDVEQSWAASSIHRWLDAGLVEGNDAGLFRPDANLTRGELATIFVRMLGLTEKADNRYSDLKGDEWYADAILKCTAAGIMEGDGTRCNATQTITRQEAMVMFARAMGIREQSDPDLSRFEDGASVAGWSAGYLAPLAELGILSGVGDGSHVAPTAQIDRASTMALLDKAISEYVTGSGQVETEEENRFVVLNAGSTSARTGSQVEVSGKTAGVVVAQGSAGAGITARDLAAGVMKVDAPVTLTLAGTTAADYVRVGAEVQMAVESEAAVAELSLHAAARVDNQGAIGRADVNAGGVVLDGKLPGSLTVADGVDCPTDSEGNPVGGGNGETDDSGDSDQSTAPAVAQVTEEDGKVTIRFDQSLYTKEGEELTKIGSSGSPEGSEVDNEALEAAGYTISGGVRITNLYVDNEEEFVWTFTFDSAGVGDGMRYNKALYGEDGSCAGYLTARRHVAAEDSGASAAGQVWTVAFEQEAEADITAPAVTGAAIDGAEVEDGGTVRFDEGAEFTALTVTLSEAVEAGSEPLKITVRGREFGTFTIDPEDAAKLHITVTNENGNRFVEGEFCFDLAAGTLRDAAGNENRAQSYTVRFEKNPA